MALNATELENEKSSYGEKKKGEKKFWKFMSREFLIFFCGHVKSSAKENDSNFEILARQIFQTKLKFILISFTAPDCETPNWWEC